MEVIPPQIDVSGQAGGIQEDIPGIEGAMIITVLIGTTKKLHRPSVWITTRICSYNDLKNHSCNFPSHVAAQYSSRRLEKEQCLCRHQE